MVFLLVAKGENMLEEKNEKDQFSTTFEVEGIGDSRINQPVMKDMVKVDITSDYFYKHSRLITRLPFTKRRALPIKLNKDALL